MIRSIRSKALKRFTEKGDPSRLPVPNQARVRRMLDRLEASAKPEDMNLPGYRFHGLEGEPRRYATDVSGNFRLTFGWEEGDAIDVDLEDYH